jgi:hypothetical protein
MKWTLDQISDLFSYLETEQNGRYSMWIPVIIWAIVVIPFWLLGRILCLLHSSSCVN